MDAYGRKLGFVNRSQADLHNNYLKPPFFPLFQGFILKYRYFFLASDPSQNLTSYYLYYVCITH